MEVLVLAPSSLPAETTLLQVATEKPRIRINPQEQAEVDAKLDAAGAHTVEYDDARAMGMALVVFNPSYKEEVGVYLGRLQYRISKSLTAVR